MGQKVRYALNLRAGGEVDCRGCYTAVATLHMLNMDKAAVLQLSGMAEFIGRCQARFLHLILHSFPFPAAHN